MDIVSRLCKFRDYTEMTNSQFADQAGIPRPTLSQFLNGRNKRLSDDLATKIHLAYPNLNMMWLLFGEGDMLINPNIEISGGKIDQNQRKFQSESAVNKHIGTLEFPDFDTPSSEPIQRLANVETPHHENKAQEMRAEVNNSGEEVVATLHANPAKTVNRIIVFYTDHSFDEFRPVGSFTNSK